MPGIERAEDAPPVPPSSLNLLTGGFYYSPPPRCRQSSATGVSIPHSFPQTGLHLPGSPPPRGSGPNMLRTAPRIAFPVNLAIDNAGRTESIVRKQDIRFATIWNLLAGWRGPAPARI